MKIKTAFLAKDSKLIPSEMTPIQCVEYIAKKEKNGYYYGEAL
jgi:hypothetical protein